MVGKMMDIFEVEDDDDEKTIGATFQFDSDSTSMMSGTKRQSLKH